MKRGRPREDWRRAGLGKTLHTLRSMGHTAGIKRIYRSERDTRIGDRAANRENAETLPVSSITRSGDPGHGQPRGRERSIRVKLEAYMTGHFSFAKTLCLLNANAQCNPIWMSQPEGLRLVHFQTLTLGANRREEPLLDSSYESCERACLQIGRIPKDAPI